MTTEEYIYHKLSKLSEDEQRISDKMISILGVWTTPEAVSRYLKKHINTIYAWEKEGILISKRVGRSIKIYTASLIFLLEE